MASKKFLDTNFHTVLAFASSGTILSCIFVVTMLRHYNGAIDWDYLFYATVQICAISIIPAMAVKAIGIVKWYWVVLTGIVVGCLAAFLFIAVLT